MQNSIELYEGEKIVLETLNSLGVSASVKKIAERANLTLNQITSASISLQLKKLVEILETKRTYMRPTNECHKYIEGKLPEKSMLEYFMSKEPPMDQLLVSDILKEKNLDLDKRNISIGLNWMRRKGWGILQKIDDRNFIVITEKGKKAVDEKEPEEKVLEILKKGEIIFEEIPPELQEGATSLKERNLLEETVKTSREIKLTENGIKVLKGEIKPVEQIAMLTGKDIRTGRYKKITLKKYDVTANPPVIFPGKKHPYLEFLEDVRRAVIGLGFEEWKGPFCETEFMNFDALFQAQDHPAREIHDSFLCKFPEYGKLVEFYGDVVEKVKMAHETGISGSTGWGYEWSLERARKIILRTQTTSVSVRYLIEHKEAPLKAFCLDRVFRPDVLDRTHSHEFHQLEGIVGDYNLTVKHLLGFLKEIVVTLIPGAKVKFKPGYFPFTEPSVEAFAFHPTIGMIEIAGSGIFRPEVTKPLDIDFPVLAWGVGIARLAMIKLGIDDIRYLHASDLQWLRNKEVW